MNEPALVEALNQKRIAGDALDCVWEELPATSGLWGVPNGLITPHTAGETRRYEDNVIGPSYWKTSNAVARRSRVEEPVRLTPGT